MSRAIVFCILFTLFSVVAIIPVSALDYSPPQHAEPTEQTIQEEDHASEEAHHGPPGWTVIPFVMLLLMIATGPLFYEHFWHKNYPKIAIALALIVVLYYLFVLPNNHAPVQALAEYVQFIALLASL